MLKAETRLEGAANNGERETKANEGGTSPARMSSDDGCGGRETPMAFSSSVLLDSQREQHQQVQRRTGINLAVMQLLDGFFNSGDHGRGGWAKVRVQRPLRGGGAREGQMGGAASRVVAGAVGGRGLLACSSGCGRVAWASVQSERRVERDVRWGRCTVAVRWARWAAGFIIGPQKRREIGPGSRIQKECAWLLNLIRFGLNFEFWRKFRLLHMQDKSEGCELFLFRTTPTIPPS